MKYPAPFNLTTSTFSNKITRLLQVQPTFRPALLSQARSHSTSTTATMSGIPPPIEKRLASLMQRNREYSETYKKPVPLTAIREKGNKAPGGGIIVISCSDPRIVPADYFKLPTGELGIIRNAGGRAFDAIRSLTVLDSLVKIGTIIVVHHTDCGQTHVLDQEVKDNIISRHPEMKDEVQKMKFGEIPEGHLEETLREDIAILKNTPLLRDEINVLGYKLDIDTGLLHEVKP